ncbi:MAG: hypothetical protein ACI9JL_001020 [Paracoccaceae bacterium]|jgi:hypothetical protein
MDSPPDDKVFRPKFSRDIQIGLNQHRGPVRRAPFAVFATFDHVGKFEPRDPKAALGKTGGKDIHELGIHRRAGPMGQYHRFFRVPWSVEQKVGHGRVLQADIQNCFGRLRTRNNGNDNPDDDNKEQAA